MNFLTRHFINDEEIRPVNADEIGFELKWTNDSEPAEEAVLSIDTIVLANRAKRLVLDHIESGAGVFEGIPYRVEVGSTVLEYYIDLVSSPVISGEGDSDIEVKIKLRKSVNYFREQANALSFESVNITNPINTIDCPYLIIRDNQLEMLIMLGISIYTLTKALIEGIKDIVVAIQEITAAATPNAGIPPSFNTGAIIGAVVLLAARVIFVAALLVALIDLTKQVIELIFPPIRNLKASTVGSCVFNTI